MHDKPVTPETAIEEFLEMKAPEVSDSTIQNLRYRLKQFRLWTDEVGIDDMRELDGRNCEQWKLARSSSGLVDLPVNSHPPR